MAQTLQKCTFALNLSVVLTNALDLSTPDDTLALSKNMTLTGGTGSGAGNQSWHDSRTLATGATENLDLYGGLTNGLGQTVNFATVRLLLIVNTSTVNTLIVGGASSNAWLGPFVDTSDKLTIRPSVSTTNFAWAAFAAPDVTGYPVTAGTVDQLKLEHGAQDSTSLTYQIVLVGQQA